MQNLTPTEHLEQVTLIAWYRRTYKNELLVAIPNGGKRHIKTAVSMKQEGTSKGFPDLFLERAAKCDPPLDDRELKTIWNSAVGFAKKIQSQEGYVPPEEFNAEFD